MFSRILFLSLIFWTAQSSAATLESLCRDFLGHATSEKCYVHTEYLHRAVGRHTLDAERRIAALENFVIQPLTLVTYNRAFVFVKESEVLSCLTASNPANKIDGINKMLIFTHAELTGFKNCVEKKTYSLRNLYPEESTLCEAWSRIYYSTDTTTGETSLASRGITWDDSIPYCTVDPVELTKDEGIVFAVNNCVREFPQVDAGHAVVAIPLKSVKRFDACLKRQLVEFGELSSPKAAAESLEYLYSRNPKLLRSPKTEVPVTFTDSLQYVFDPQ